MLRRTVVCLALVPALLWVADLRAQAPAPQPVLSSPDACPAVVRFSYDVSGFAGADRVRWQIRRAAPGQDFTAATGVDSGDALGATGSVQRDLRNLGPVLDGTRYFIRLRARQVSTDLSGWSEPVLFEQDLAPDGMFTLETVEDRVRVDYALTGPIAACADRVAVEMKNGGWTTPPPDEEDPAADSYMSRSGVQQADNDFTDVPVGDHEVRLVARYGASTSDDEVSRWSAPVRVTMVGRPATLAVTVLDVVGKACSTTTAALRTATVRLTAPDGTETTATTDGSGQTSFDVLTGTEYTLSATSSMCAATATQTVRVSADDSATVLVEGCHNPTADVSAFVQSPGPGTPGTPYAFSIGLQSEAGFHSRAGELRVERIGTSAAPVLLATVPVSPVCMGQVRSIPVTDPAPVAGSPTYRATLALEDANAANNVHSRIISFPAPVAEAVTAEFSYINVSRFRLQGGAATISTGTPVTLDVTAEGQPPTQYKAAECGASFDGTAFQAWPASPPPTLPGFTTTGQKIVCLQLKGSSATSSVARDTISAALQVVPVVVNVVAVRSLQLRGGAQYVVKEVPVTVEATAIGSPTHYRTRVRVRDCESEIQSAPWRSWSPASPPTLTFSTLGPRTVCFQLKRDATPTPILSAVAEDQIEVVSNIGFSEGFGPGTDSYADHRCPSFTHAVGARIRADKYVRTFQLVCMHLGANGEHEGDVYLTTTGGSSSATRTELLCPSGQVLYGVVGFTGLMIDVLRIICRPWSDALGSHGEWDTSDPVGGPGGFVAQPVLCRQDMFGATEARVGTIHGAIGFIQLGCQPPVAWTEP